MHGFPTVKLMDGDSHTQFLSWSSLHHILWWLRHRSALCIIFCGGWDTRWERELCTQSLSLKLSWFVNPYRFHFMKLWWLRHWVRERESYIHIVFSVKLIWFVNYYRVSFMKLGASYSVVAETLGERQSYHLWWSWAALHSFIHEARCIIFCGGWDIGWKGWDTEWETKLPSLMKLSCSINHYKCLLFMKLCASHSVVAGREMSLMKPSCKPLLVSSCIRFCCDW